MQLIRKKGKIGKIIAHAALSLTCVATNVAHAKSANTSDGYFSKKYASVKNWADWSGEIGFLGYSESDGRVQALEPAVSLSAEFEGEKVWNFKLVYDSLTGSSPNGALASDQPQTFTSPSGNANYQIAPGELPLYDQFIDTRVQISSSWSQPLSRLMKGSIGFNASNEYDYLSLGLNASVTKETESKNTSFSLGLSYTSDTISPVGGAPIPLAQMTPSGTAQAKSQGDESKTTLDILLGVLQIMSRSWIVQANLSVGLTDGYSNDPYKLVTVYDDAIGANLGDPLRYLFESRPDSRMKQSVFLGSKKQTNLGVLSTAYRYYTDDWGIDSHTLDLALNFKVSEKWRLEPNIRYYSQSGADFFRYGLGSSEALPQHVTADTRLADMTAITPGLKIIKKLKDEKELSFLLQYYMQTGDSSPSTAVGSQVGQDLFPDLNALIVHVIYSF
ncbi:MAG: DUF3570 domain-containing protein [Bdellovibrionales bacterium]